jgi:hypothetical protein
MEIIPINDYLAHYMYISANPMWKVPTCHFQHGQARLSRFPAVHLQRFEQSFGDIFFL